jgi:uncharacterized protein (TIGR02145 family)
LLIKMSENMIRCKFNSISRIFIIVNLLLTASLIKAQVAFNGTGTMPDSSAMLDVSSASKGMLIPRMTSSQREQISNPAIGLMVYQTDNNAGFYHYSANGWEALDTPCGQAVNAWDYNYHSIRFGSQCWLKENLNTLTQIVTGQNQQNNGIVEKYCDGDTNCQVYGGLYTWNEMMAWTTSPGGRGICPSGWRVPTDEDWKILEGNMDYMYSVGDPAWDNSGARGYNAGNSLKAASTWLEDPWNPVHFEGDFLGFKARAGGYYNPTTLLYNDLGSAAYFWTSSANGGSAWSRKIVYTDSTVVRELVDKNMAYSVRCVRDAGFDCSPMPTVADAGPDQLNITGLSATLEANAPEMGAGQWSIVSGTGGNIADSLNPVSGFTGIEGNSYTLRWTITACSASKDDVTISFACPTANGGPDQLNVQGTSTTLQGNTPFAGSGVWSIYSGTGGNIVTPTDPGSTFTGVGGRSYELCWTITSQNCETVSDTVIIRFTCDPSITINHVAGNVSPVTKTVTYGIVSNIPGAPSKCWITSNLGSDHQATAVDDGTEASAGWYWQFNRQQGYKHDGTTRTPNTTWITSINENSDWLSANDPCALLLGTGWRLPTSTEWTNVNASGGWTDWNGPWASALKLHVAGYLSAGSLWGSGSDGYYWSSLQQGNINGRYLFIEEYSCGMDYNSKTYGFSVRCLKN